jgi:nucleoside-diphosphate-sugar epimerase
MKNEKYLVTGAAGFVGSAVVRELLQRGKKVRALVRNGSIKNKTLKGLGLDVEIVEGDLKNPASLLKAAEGCSGVFHIAALFRQVNVPDEEFDLVNVKGTESMLKASIEAGVKRFVHCSTCGVVTSSDNPICDETEPYKPGDIYQRSKVEGEKTALHYFREGKISGVVIRPAMIFGPGDQRTLKLFRMINRRRFFYVGTGDKLVHWIDVRDLARAFCQAMESTTTNAEVYIVAGKKPLSLKEFVELVAKKLEVPKPWLHIPVRPMQWLGVLCETVCQPFGIEPPLYKRRVDFYIKNRSYNTSKVKSQLAFTPRQDIELEVSDIIDNYRQSNLL